MPKYKFSYGGKNYSVMADSPDKAAPMIDDVVSHLGGSQKPMEQNPTDPMADEGAAQAQAVNQILPQAFSFIKKATPIGSMQEIGGQLSGERPGSPLKAGLAAADIVATPLLAMATGGGSAPAQSYFTKLLAGYGTGAASVAASEGAQAAGAPAAVSIPLGIAAGIGAGRAMSPEMAMRAVPKGQEAAALSRAAGKIGLPIAAPIGEKPRDVINAWNAARQGLGAEVGAAKEAALQTEKSAPEVIGAVRKAVSGGLGKAKVPIVNGALTPSLATEPAAAEKMLEQVGRLSAIPENATGSEALTLANNVLEGTKKAIAESKKLGTGLSGLTSKSVTSEWQKAIDALGPQDKVKVARELDSAYSKLMTLGGMATKAASTKTGAVAGFSPREFVFQWERLPEAARSKFTPAEVALLDGLTKQQPGWVSTGIQKALELAKNHGLRGLSWHPTTRFYEEMVRPVGPRASASSVLPLTRSKGE